MMEMTDEQTLILSPWQRSHHGKGGRGGGADYKRPEEKMVNMVIDFSDSGCEGRKQNYNIK